MFVNIRKRYCRTEWAEKLSPKLLFISSNIDEFYCLAAGVCGCNLFINASPGGVTLWKCLPISCRPEWLQLCSTHCKSNSRYHIVIWCHLFYLAHWLLIRCV